jgi:SAM-dependent methyltransferase/glycosyltransferase involved in cell wall biosynthesis
MKRPNTVTVVLPAYGVANAIASVVRDLAVAAYALRIRGMQLDVLVLNGDGPAAAAAAEAVAVELGLPVKIVDGPTAGAGSAFLQGFRNVVEEGRADLVATLDATGRHDATEIPRLVDLLVDRGLHVVIGSRWARGSGTPGLSVGRWVLGRLANLAFRAVTGTYGIADATTSFRIARIEVVRDFDLAARAVNSHSVQTNFVAMAVARGYRVGEGPIIYRAPVSGGGGLGFGDVTQFIRHLRGLRGGVERIREQRLAPSGRKFDDEHFGAADDIEQLSTAKNFFDWVLDEFDPYLRGRVLDVGAGTGTITRKLVERYPDITVTALEPAENMIGDLQAYAALHPRVEVHRMTLADYSAPAGGFDAAMYLNVLEHIADDGTELVNARAALRPGGALLVFGPAHEWLYCDLDYKAGHYRRYSVQGLRSVVTAAGFEVVSLRYFDVLGVAPYWFVYRLLRHNDIPGSTMWMYDRLIVPTSRMLQRFVPHPPFGKNVILVARKSV